MRASNWIKKLHSLEKFGIKPGLQRIHTLLHLLGDPQDGLRAVHVAGTNGKGSVCAMLEAVLRQAGFRTGLFTSPHLVDLRERFQVMGRPISPSAFEAIMARIWPAVEWMARGPEGPPTFFEATTALGLCWFKQRRVEVVVLETGMGGRFDSTNVFARPLATVITNIDLDHTQILGGSVEQIAWEKAGIAKPHANLVTGARGPALNVIRQEWELVQRGGREKGRAAARFLALAPGKNWSVAQEGVAWGRVCGQRLRLRLQGKTRRLFLPLLGPHQHANLACAVAALEEIKRSGLPWSEDDLARGLAGTRWPGRLQVLGLNPRVILDGAHNPAGARALAESIRGLRQGRVAVVMGVLKDKDWAGILKPLVGAADRFFFSSPRDKRALPARPLLALARRLGAPAEAQPSLRRALAAARRWAGTGDTVVVAGSLYTVGEVLRGHSQATH